LGFFHFLLLAVASDKAYQLLAHEILLKVALSTKNQINQSFFYFMRMQQIENKQ
jgi:hypothetical protein